MAEESRWITAQDLRRSATTHMMPDLWEALRPLRGLPLGRLLDIGCGFGGLSRLVADELEIAEAHGIDRDAEALEEARSKGIVTHHLDVGTMPLPLPPDHIDLVMSFGMLDYLPEFDPLLREVHRVLRPGGCVLVSLPNLAAWHNRLVLLLGYQPRDVEVSREKVVGVHPWYRSDSEPVGHIHTVTVPAFCELMEYHGFQTVRVTPGTPGGRAKAWVVRWLDAMLARRATLARRFFYLGRRSDRADGRRSS